MRSSSIWSHFWPRSCCAPRRPAATNDITLIDVGPSGDSGIFGSHIVKNLAVIKKKLLLPPLHFPTETPIQQTCYRSRDGALSYAGLLWIGSLMIYWFGNPLESSIKWTKRPTVRLRPVTIPVIVNVCGGYKLFSPLHRPFSSTILWWKYKWFICALWFALTSLYCCSQTSLNCSDPGPLKVEEASTRDRVPRL